MTDSTEESRTLRVEVSDTVGVKNIGPDGKEESKEGEKKEEDPKARYYEDVMDYLDRYVPFAHKPARPITEEDLETVKEEGHVLVQLCRIPRGRYGNVPANAHSLISAEPLRFFVTAGGEFIINPVITGHSSHPCEEQEGSMTHPEELRKTVTRFNVIEMKFQTLVRPEGGDEKSDPVLSKVIEEKYTGNVAKVFQHQCALLNGYTIYDEEVPDPLWAINKKEEVIKN